MRQNQQLKDKQKELQKLTPADFHRKIQDFLRNLVDKLEGTGVEINLEPVSIEAMVLSALCPFSMFDRGHKMLKEPQFQN